jgi:hypothetical protein
MSDYCGVIRSRLSLANNHSGDNLRSLDIPLLVPESKIVNYLQRRLPPCVYDERPRLPVGLAVGAADQAPRACDSARGLTGKERAISRFVAPGPRVRIHLPPAGSLLRT